MSAFFWCIWAALLAGWITMTVLSLIARFWVFMDDDEGDRWRHEYMRVFILYAVMGFLIWALLLNFLVGE